MAIHLTGPTIDMLICWPALLLLSSCIDTYSGTSRAPNSTHHSILSSSRHPKEIAMMSYERTVRLLGLLVVFNASDPPPSPPGPGAP